MYSSTLFPDLDVIEFQLFSKIKSIFREPRFATWKILKMSPAQVHKTQFCRSLNLVTQATASRDRVPLKAIVTCLLKIMSFITLQDTQCLPYLMEGRPFPLPRLVHNVSLTDSVWSIWKLFPTNTSWKGEAQRSDPK